MNLLLDTNVYIDYLGGREPFAKPARKLVAAGFFGDVRLWVPAQSVTDAFFVLRKFKSSRSIQNAMGNSFKMINVVDVTARDATRAVDLQWDDLEDCLIALSAQKANADYLVTRDAKGFKRSAVPTATPNQIATMLWEEHGLDYEELKLG